MEHCEWRMTHCPRGLLRPVQRCHCANMSITCRSTVLASMMWVFINLRSSVRRRSISPRVTVRLHYHLEEGVALTRPLSNIRSKAVLARWRRPVSTGRLHERQCLSMSVACVVSKVAGDRSRQRESLSQIGPLQLPCSQYVGVRDDCMPSTHHCLFNNRVDSKQ